MYVVPDAKKSIAQNQFEFQIGRSTYRIPAVKYLTRAQTRKIVERVELEMDSIVEAARIMGQQDLAEKLENLPNQVLEDLNDAWYKDSGITLGESDGSTSSAESTVEPSSPSSPDTDTDSTTSE